MPDVKGKFPNGLSEAMRQKPIGPTALANLSGESKQNVTRWANQTRRLNREAANKLAPHVGVSAAALLLVDQITSKNRPNKEQVIQEAEAAPEFDDPKSRLGAPTLPILGVTLGGRDDDRGPDFWMNGETSAHVSRPRKLEGRKDVFGLYVHSDSMEPRYRPRDLVIVEKAAPGAGDDVVIELKPTREDDDADNPSFIKEFVARRGSFITVKQLNPPKEIDFDLKEIKNLFRVIPLKELMG